MAYILGLFTGGGRIQNNTCTIEFPFKNWSGYKITTEMYKDSIERISPLVEDQIGAKVIPKSQIDRKPYQFLLLFKNIPQLFFETLTDLNIPRSGDIRACIHSIDQIIKAMEDDRTKKCFLQGLADIVGSCRPSHRHRTEGSTIVSFELLRNYNLTFELCQLLHNLNVPVNQILWNHPNIHSGKQPNYKYWRKGNKLRIRSGDFKKIGYNLQSKREGLHALLEIEMEISGVISHDTLCPNRRYSCSQCKKVTHDDEYAEDLPLAVRGHKIHYTDICESLGCPHAPSKWLTQQRLKYLT